MGHSFGMNRLLRFFALLIAIGCSCGPLRAEPRQWTNTSGAKITAEFVRMDQGAVVLLLGNGKQSSVLLASLSAADQAWVKANGSRVMASLAKDPNRLPWDKRFMPGAVQEPQIDMNIKVVKEEPGDCTYESGHFQFKTTAKLGALVMKDICGAFESTHELVRRLPWGITPRPEEGRAKFRAELFETRAEYLRAGAPTWSGGVYVVKDKVFRIPFEEVGLTKVPTNKTSGYSRSGPINNDTITHEITHQMMHEYLPFAPVWMLEGTAEYTAHLPYRSGEFNVTGALQSFKEMRDTTRKPAKRRLFRSLAFHPSWIGVNQLWGFTRDITQRTEPKGEMKTKGEKGPKGVTLGNAPEVDPRALADRYYSSHALVFYFMHLDGGGNAARIKKYFDAIHEEKAKWADFWPKVDAYRKKVDELRPAYEAYKRAMSDFMKQPGVKDLGDGRFSYPTNLTPPAAPPAAPEAPKAPDGTDPDEVCLKHLNVLLDGRSLYDLDNEVRTAFLKAGVTL